MQKHRYSSVSKFATLSLVVIFSFSLLHHEWWQAAGCVVAFVLLANLPYIFNGNMWSGRVVVTKFISGEKARRCC